MGFKDFTVDTNLDNVSEGNVIKVDGHKYKVVKKVGKKVAVTRHYWFDSIFDKIAARVRLHGNT